MYKSIQNIIYIHEFRMIHLQQQPGLRVQYKMREQENISKKIVRIRETSFIDRKARFFPPFGKEIYKKEKTKQKTNKQTKKPRFFLATFAFIN